MKGFACIFIISILYTNNFFVLTLPVSVKETLKRDLQLNQERSLKNDDLSSGRFNPEYMGGHYQGDMILPDEILRGAASRPLWQRWPNGIIPYVIRPSISTNHTLLILDAMRAMENLTQVHDKLCIQFREKTDNDSIFITIQNGTGCSAHVGYLQNFTLNRTVTLMHTPTSTCMINGTIQHELLHILGFYHEQSRPDRDQHVSIEWENIISGTERNFVKYSEVDVDMLSTAYDYASVMHYGSTAFSMNGLPTIIPIKNSSIVLGQRVGMSAIDILEVQRYYGCIATPTTTSSSIMTTTGSAGTVIRFEILLVFLLPCIVFSN